MDLGVGLFLVIVSLIGLVGMLLDKEEKPIVLEKEAFDKFVDMLEEPKRANQYLLEGMSRYNQIQKKTETPYTVFKSQILLDPKEIDGKNLKMCVGMDTNPEGQTCVTIGGYDKNENRLYVLSTFMVDK